MRCGTGSPVGGADRVGVSAHHFVLKGFRLTIRAARPLTSIPGNSVTLDGEAHVIPAGHSIEVPTGAAHTYANRSDGRVRFSAEHEPALDFEEYIRLVHRTVAGNRISLPIILRIVRIESSYGNTVLSPPGFPRVINTILSGAGKLMGYPTGKRLATRAGSPGAR